MFLKEQETKKGVVIMKKICYIYTSKNNNLYFTIGKHSYVILDRDRTEIGSQNNYATKILFEVDKKK